MKRLAIIILAALLCRAALFKNSRSIPPESQTTEAKTICFTDTSGDYLFIQNLSETEKMLQSLQDYLGNAGIQIRASIPEDAFYYAESTWDPAWAAVLPGGPGYCVEAWDIFKNGEFQKISYLAAKVQSDTA